MDHAEKTARIEHLQSLKKHYEDLINSHNQKLNDTQTKIWQYEAELALINSVFNSKTLAQLHFNDFSNKADRYQKELPRLRAELKQLKERNFADENSIIYEIDMQIEATQQR